MDNSGFEMNEETPPSSSAKTKRERMRQVRPKKPWSLLNIFLVCLLACALTTSVGALILSTACISHGCFTTETKNEATVEKRGIAAQGKTSAQMQVDPKFQFLHQLSKSKKYQFPGGTIQWSTYWKNDSKYQNKEEMAFGRSINAQQSKMMFGTLRIKSKGLRAPHWHFNANEQGYLLKGSAWIGVADAGGNTVTTYNVTTGQVIFFPRNTLHWIKNTGAEDCLFLLFFTTHEELQTLDMDDAFFATPEDIAARSLKPQGGVDFIKTFEKQGEDQAISLPPNLAELVQQASYEQSVDKLMNTCGNVFYGPSALGKSSFICQVVRDVGLDDGSREFLYPGGKVQWARYVKGGKGLSDNERIYSEFLHSKADTLTLGTLRIYSNGLRQPHFHFNANEMGYVISGCGKVGVIVSTEVTTNFNIDTGDVIFFPVGTQHYIKSTCNQDLLLILAFSTGSQLETLDMDDYFHAIPDHILAQLFFKKQDDFKKFPRLKEDQAINLP